MNYNFIRYEIVGGPEWERCRSHDGEIVKFMVMKRVACPQDDAGAELILEPVLVKPVEVYLKIDYVATPLQPPRKTIRGEIVNKVKRGELLPKFKSDAGVLFLKKGLYVEIEYDIETKAGFVGFEDHSSRDWLRIRNHGEWLSGLMDIKGGRRSNGVFCEMPFYMHLNNPRRDLQRICHNARVAASPAEVIWI